MAVSTSILYNHLRNFTSKVKEDIMLKLTISPRLLKLTATQNLALLESSTFGWIFFLQCCKAYLVNPCTSKMHHYVRLISRLFVASLTRS